MIASQLLFSFSETTIEAVKQLCVLQTWFSSYVWLNSANCLPVPSGHSAPVSLEFKLKFSRLTAAPVFTVTYTEDEEAQRFWSSTACWDSAERHPDEPQIDHFLSIVKHPTTYNQTAIMCVSDHRWERLDPAWQSQGADHCLTATTTNKAVRRPHWGIGIVSEAVRWGEEWGWGLSWHALSPDALTASHPARNQTSGLLFPASTEVTETTVLRSAELHLCWRRWNSEGQNRKQEVSAIYIHHSYSAEHTHLYTDSDCHSNMCRASAVSLAASFIWQPRSCSNSLVSATDCNFEPTLRQDEHPV